MNHDDTAGHVSGDHSDLPSQADLDAVAGLDGLLDDPSLWVQPPAGLQEQIVEAIAQARDVRKPRVWLHAALGAAAALVVASGVVLGLNVFQNGDAVTFSATLSGSSLAPDASGEAELTKTTSGWEIYLHAEGLPRRADGEYYEAWLKDADGKLVPVGTFNSFEDVTLWSGVPPTSHPTFTVTRQVADGNPASTGEVVLSGVATATD